MSDYHIVCFHLGNSPASEFYVPTYFGPFFFRPLSGCIFLALGVLYHDDKVYCFDAEISNILTSALLWRV